MSSVHRRFYGKYYLLTILLPAYALTALHYSVAWYLLYLTGRPASGLLEFQIFAFLVFLVLLFPLARIGQGIADIGFMLTGVPGGRKKPGPELKKALDAAFAKIHSELDFQAGLEICQVNTGGTPFLGINDDNPRKLLVSPEVATALDTETLSCLLAHEIGHTAVTMPLKYRLLATGPWLFAFLCAWLLHDLPWILVAAALVHSLVWLRIVLRITMEVERQADQTAIGLVGRERYISAFIKYYHYLAAVDSKYDRSKNVHRRLAGMGMPSAEITARLADNATSSAD